MTAGSIVTNTLIDFQQHQKRRPKRRFEDRLCESKKQMLRAEIIYWRIIVAQKFSVDHTIQKYRGPGKRPRSNSSFAILLLEGWADGTKRGGKLNGRVNAVAWFIARKRAKSNAFWKHCFSRATWAACIFSRSFSRLRCSMRSSKSSFAEWLLEEITGDGGALSKGSTNGHEGSSRWIAFR